MQFTNLHLLLREGAYFFVSVALALTAAIPTSSFADETCMSPYIFICDGSSLVTSGRGQPTMTIQALALRASEHITKFAQGGEI